MTLIVRKHFGIRHSRIGRAFERLWWKSCLTLKMSHDYGWRGSCAAGDVTAMVVGSGALLGSLVSGSKCDISSRCDTGN